MECTTETLAGGTKVLIDKVHRFGTDAFLLSDFCLVKYNQTVLDIGTGCGIIPLRWKDRGHEGLRIGLDIDRDATALLSESIKLNGIENLLRVTSDIRQWNTPLRFDAISCNPPYFTAGLSNRDPKKAGARHQFTLTDEDVARAGERLLKDGGKLCLCQRPRRIATVFYAMKNHCIEPKRLRLVRRKPDSPRPFLALIDGRKNGGPGLEILPELVIQDGSGNFSKETLKIYDKI